MAGGSGSTTPLALGDVSNRASPAPASAATTPGKPGAGPVRLGRSVASYYFEGTSGTGTAGGAGAGAGGGAAPGSSARSARKLLRERKEEAEKNGGGGLREPPSVEEGGAAAAAAVGSFGSPASSSSDGEGGALDRSVLSDTTELTASNFVLAASSRQRLRESAQGLPRRAEGGDLDGNGNGKEQANSNADADVTPDAYATAAADATAEDGLDWETAAEEEDDHDHDHDDTGMDWEAKEEAHLYTAELSAMVRAVARAQGAVTKAQTSAERAVGEASPGPHRSAPPTPSSGTARTPASSSSSSNAAAAAPSSSSHVLLPSPSDVADGRRLSLGGRRVPGSASSSGTAAEEARSARRLLGSLRRTKERDGAAVAAAASAASGSAASSPATFGGTTLRPSLGGGGGNNGGDDLTDLLPPLTPMGVRGGRRGGSLASADEFAAMEAEAEREVQKEEVEEVRKGDHDDPNAKADADAPTAPSPSEEAGLQHLESPARNTRSRSSKRKSLGREAPDVAPPTGGVPGPEPGPEPEPATEADPKRRRSTGSPHPPPAPYPDSPARNTRGASKRKSLGTGTAGFPAASDDDGSVLSAATASPGDGTVGGGGGDDVTANTVMLKDILLGLPVEAPAEEEGQEQRQQVATSRSRASKRRKSVGTAGSDGSGADDEEDDDDLDVTGDAGARRMTADTDDLKDLLGLRDDLAREDAVGGGAAPSRASVPPSPSSGTSVAASAASPDTMELVANLHYDGDQSGTSTPGPDGKENGEGSDPPMVGSVPKGILNSGRKKQRDSVASRSGRPSILRRSVAFGSPEAAEYNVGSPSVSLTPMPSKQAKEMFSVPQKLDSSMSSRDASASEEDDTADLDDIAGVLGGGSQTTELEEDVNALLQQASADGAGDADTETPSHDQSATAVLEEDVQGLLAAAAAEDSAGETPTLSPGDSSFGSSLGGGEKTIELEGDMNALLARNGDGLTMMSIEASRIDQAGTPEREETAQSPTDSIEMTDAKSLASANSHPSGGEHVPSEEDLPNDSDSFQSKKLTFDNKVNQNSDSLSQAHAGEDQTQELDVDLPALLENAYAYSKNSPAGRSSRGSVSRFSSAFIPKTNRMSFGTFASAEATQTIELEGNMDSLLGNFGEDSTDTEAESTDADNAATVEIEGDISALLAEVGGGKASIEFDDAPPSSKKKRSQRRKSRFSLAPRGRISLSTDGNRVVETTLGGGLGHVEEKSGTEHTTPVPVPEPEQEEIINLTFADICTASEFLNDHPESISPGFDIVMDACNIMTDCRGESVVNATNQFFDAVCANVEANVEAQDDLDGEAEVLNYIESMPNEMRLIQRAILSTSETPHRIVEALKSLASQAEEYALADWREWEVQVAEALKPSIEQVSQDTAQDEEAINSKVRLADDMHESLALMADRKVRKARRKSMRRRKTAVSKMEDELRDLELQIEDAEEELEENRKEKQRLACLSESLRAQASAESELQLQKRLAEVSRGKISSVERLHIWSPRCLQESEISVCFKDFVKDPALVVQFLNVQEQPISCVAALEAMQENSVVLKSVGSYKYSPSVAAFVKARLQQLVAEVPKTTGGIAGLKLSIQTLEWQMGRLELLAKELQRLISHHDGVLYRQGEAFGVRFDVGGKLRVKIIISSSLGHGPLDLVLAPIKGDVNTSKIRRQLIKNSKPGFGSMSRALDIIAAAVR